MKIGGVTMQSPTGELVFSSPEIPSGTVYYYKVEAEIVRGGKTYATTNSVAVEAGLNSKLTLDPNEGSAVASK